MSADFDPYIRLHSGRKFHFLKPSSRDICIEDIAHNLSRICRFTGASKRFYSVAEHAVWCSRMAPEEHRFTVLNHDDAEFVMGDVNSPLKSLLPQYKAIERQVESVICAKYRIPFPFPAIVKEIDLRMLVTEMRQLLSRKDWKKIPFVPFDIELPCWDSARARHEFLKAFKRYS